MTCVHHRVDGLENICKVRHKDWSVHYRVDGLKNS